MTVRFQGGLAADARGYSPCLNWALRQVGNSWRTLTVDGNDYSGAVLGNTWYLAFDAKTVAFTVGQVLTGAVSGATGTIAAVDDNGTTGTLYLSGVTGTFQDNEAVTDPALGAAVANGIARRLVDTNYDPIDPLPPNTSAWEVRLLNDSSSPSDITDVEFTCWWDNGGAVTDVGSGVGYTIVSKDVANRTCKIQPTQNTNVFFVLELDETNGDGTPPTNLRVVPTAKVSAFNGGKLLDPDWKGFLQRFPAANVLWRPMDMMGTNSSNAVDYADLADTSFGGIFDNGNPAKLIKTGMPPAMIAEFMNEVGATWMTIPHQFSDAAVTSFATDLRDNVTYPASRPEFLGVEYGNENWNPDFAQRAYMVAQAAITPGIANEHQYSGYRAAQVSDIFRTVFGTDSGEKWFGVLATQEASTSAYVTAQRLMGAQYYIDNEAAPGTTMAKLFSYIAPAIYFGKILSNFTSDPGLTYLQYGQQGLDAFCDWFYDYHSRTDIANNTFRPLGWSIARWAEHKALADTNGLGMCAYEGGYGSFLKTSIVDNGSAESNLMRTILRDAAEHKKMGELTNLWFDTFLTETGGFGSKYLAFSSRSFYGPWGMRDSMKPFDSNDAADLMEARAFGVTPRVGFRPFKGQCIAP